MAVRLALLWAVDATETDALRVLVVQHFDGVAVEDGDDGAGEVGGLQFSRSQEQFKIAIATSHPIRTTVLTDYERGGSI
jgi:hypothetical protein